MREYGDSRRPSDHVWQAQLGQQTETLGAPQEALAVARSTLANIGAW